MSRLDLTGQRFGRLTAEHTARVESALRDRWEDAQAGKEAP